MANRLFTPIAQFCDQNGAPYAGGSLSFYVAGTSTPLAVYSDKGLSVSLGTVVTLDSGGRPNSAGAGGAAGFEVGIFLLNLAYKVVLADVNSNQIWSADNVYASDFSTIAQFNGNAGSPNGSVAGTQASSGVPASTIWDFTNNILYVCTTTGNAAGAVWTAVNASSATPVVPAPQGFLSTTINNLFPIQPTGSNVVDATQVNYVALYGQLVPIWNGSQMVPYSFGASLLYNLQAQHLQLNIYDFYVFLVSGVPTLGTGPSWTGGAGGSITSGSCGRGTGAGGAAITRAGGFVVNNNQMTMRTSTGTTPSINPFFATYLGSMYVSGSGNGKVSTLGSWGQNITWGIWNQYNRVPITLTGGDSMASWTYGTAAWRASNVLNSGTANNILTFVGMPEEAIDIDFRQIISGGVTSVGYKNGIGWNSTSSPSGFTGQFGNGSAATQWGSMTSRYTTLPGTIGLNTVTMLENAAGGTNGNYQGGSANAMQMNVTYRG